MVESRRSLRMLAKIGSHDRRTAQLSARRCWPFWRMRTNDGIFTPIAVADATDIELSGGVCDGFEADAGTRFALDHGENEEDSCCIGVPIFHPNGKMIAGLSLSAPATRVSSVLEGQIGSALIEACHIISSALKTPLSRNQRRPESKGKDTLAHALARSTPFCHISAAPSGRA